MMEIPVVISTMSYSGNAEFIRTGVLFYIIFISGYVTVETVGFNYNRNPRDIYGVYNWPSLHGTHCNGMYQSPINIELDDIRGTVPSCMCTVFSYDTPKVQGIFKNNGHAPTFTLDSSNVVTLTNVPNENVWNTYRLHGFHFHYGGVHGKPFDPQEHDQQLSSSQYRRLYDSLMKSMGSQRASTVAMHTEQDRQAGSPFSWLYTFFMANIARSTGKRKNGHISPGSEHTVDERRYDGELHFVFFNTKYDTINDAMNEPDGLVVLSIFIQQVPDSRHSDETRQVSEFLLENIPKILPVGETVTTSVDLDMFFSDRRCEYYTYRGSTTTPPCVESVRWIIFRDYLQVTKDAWYILSGLASSGDFYRKYGNYRVLQPMNGRMVQRNWGSMEHCGSIISH